MTENTEPDRPDAEYTGDEINTGMIAIVGVFSAVVFFLIFILLQAWFYTWKGEVATARAMPTDDPQTPLGQMLIEQEQQLNTYHWVDQEKQVRAIPIERAMAIVADEMASAGKDANIEVKHDIFP
jgi:hypothetical protein